MKTIIFIIAVILIYQNFFGDESGCDAYASNYSCEYLKNKAQYEVWYWHNVEDNDPRDEKFIGTVTGLSACYSYARNYHATNESYKPWNNRSYICALMKDGKRMEKHRL